MTKNGPALYNKLSCSIRNAEVNIHTSCTHCPMNQSKSVIEMCVTVMHSYKDWSHRQYAAIHFAGTFYINLSETLLGLPLRTLVSQPHFRHNTMKNACRELQIFETYCMNTRCTEGVLNVFSDRRPYFSIARPNGHTYD